MAIYQIPLANGAQFFSVTLAGKPYKFRLLYNDAGEGCWNLDIADANGKVMLAGLALVAGIDILRPYKHLGFGGGLFLDTPGEPDHEPSYEDLGTRTRLLFVTR